MERTAQATQTVVTQAEETKMLGAHVAEDLYWAFKKAAAGRNEQLKDAIAHAARMYIDAAPEQIRKGG